MVSTTYCWVLNLSYLLALYAEECKGMVHMKIVLSSPADIPLLPQSVETIRLQAAWLERDGEDIANFFKQRN